MQTLNQNVKKANLIAPVRGDATGTEKYVGLANFDGANLCVGVNIGTSNGQAILTLKQAKTVAGGSEKALAFTRAVKTANFGSASTTTELTSLNSSIRVGVSTGNQLYQIDVKSTDLDVANGFKYVRVDLGSSIADTVFYGTADLYHARHTGGPGKFPASS